MFLKGKGVTKYHIGKVIREARRAARMSQMQLAEKVGISYQQIQKYEKGASELSLPRLSQIAEVLDIPLESFFSKEDLIAERRPPYGKLSLEENTLLAQFRKIRSIKTKKVLITAIKAIAEQES